MTRPDIETRQAIDALMRRFYEKAMADDTIGRFFTDVVHLDLERHLPVIGDFWESLLLGADAYRKHGRHPLRVHAEIDRKEPLRVEHFERWLELFRETVDELYAGPRAEFAKLRSGMIANRMLAFIAEDRRKAPALRTTPTPESSEAKVHGSRHTQDLPDGPR